MKAVALSIGVAAAGLTASTVGAVAQAAGDATSEVIPYASAGGSALAVAALAYVVRKFLAGDLVAKATAEYMREQSVMLAVSGDREDKAMAQAERVIKLAERLEKQQTATNRLLWRVDQRLGGTDDRREPRRTE